MFRVDDVSFLSRTPVLTELLARGTVEWPTRVDCVRWTLVIGDWRFGPSKVSALWRRAPLRLPGASRGRKRRVARQRTGHAIAAPGGLRDGVFEQIRGYLRGEMPLRFCIPWICQVLFGASRQAWKKGSKGRKTHPEKADSPRGCKTPLTPPFVTPHVQLPEQEAACQQHCPDGSR